MKNAIVDIQANEKIRARISIVRVTGLDGTDALYLTSGTSISIVDLLGGEVGSQGFTGFQGKDGYVGADGADGATGATGFQGFTGFQGATGPDLPGVEATTYTQYKGAIGNNQTEVVWDSGTVKNAIKFSTNLIPSESDKYDLGGTAGYRWNSIHVKDIFMSADTLFQSLPGESKVIKALSIQADGIIQLPAGTLIGGVNPGTIVIRE